MDDHYLFDVAQELAADFTKRLTFYKLRAAVTIEPQENDTQVYACWGEAVDDTKEALIKDPRLAALGQRLYSDITPSGEPGNYTQHRISLGIPQGENDFSYGDAYPHETLMDQFGGVDFKKGCYVGQEVVSRMQHRGTAKKRIVKISASGDLPPQGTIITAAGKPAGETGSVWQAQGLALVRLDRIANAVNSSAPVLADDVPITLTLPDWVGFNWPEAV